MHRRGGAKMHEWRDEKGPARPNAWSALVGAAASALEFLPPPIFQTYRSRP
jgi:hypothetical protein